MKGFPSKFTAGDSFSFDVASTCDTYGNTISSDDGWTLSIHLRANVAGATVDIEGVPDDVGGWTFEFPASESEKFEGAARVAWSLRATKDDEARTISKGVSDVLKDIAAVATVPFDERTQAEKDLDAVRAAMRAMISGGAVAKYSVAGRSVEKMSMADLLSLETKLKTEVAREKQAAAKARGERPRTNMFVRFGR